MSDLFVFMMSFEVTEWSKVNNSCFKNNYGLVSLIGWVNQPKICGSTAKAFHTFKFPYNFAKGASTNWLEGHETCILYFIFVINLDHFVESVFTLTSRVFSCWLVPEKPLWLNIYSSTYVSINDIKWTDGKIHRDGGIQEDAASFQPVVNNINHFPLKKRHFCHSNQTLMSLIFSTPFCDEFPSAKYFRILCPRRCNLNNISHRAAARIRIMSTLISHLTRSRGKTFPPE